MKASTAALGGITKGDIFDDGDLFSPSEAAILKVKDDLLTPILRRIDERGYTQKQLVEILDEYQPNVSDLLRGKISKFSIEKLVYYASRLNLEPRVAVSTHRSGVAARQSGNGKRKRRAA